MDKTIIDMHCHTTHSDGAQHPEEMMQIAEDRGIHIFAITDHDAVTRVGGAREEG